MKKEGPRKPPSELVELTSLQGELGQQLLGALKSTNSGHELGALVTLAQLTKHADLDKGHAALRQAAASAATPGIRNLATLGGNLLQRPRCWYFRSANLSCLKKGGSACLAITGENKYHAILGGGPSSSSTPSTLASALLALDARIEISGETTRIIPIAELFVGPKTDPKREHSLAPGELSRTRAAARAPAPPPAPHTPSPRRSSRTTGRSPRPSSTCLSRQVSSSPRGSCSATSPRSRGAAPRPRPR